jgi:small-conductance mechanosensitive channel
MAQWQTARGELVGYVNVLAERATVLEEILERLTTLRETWTRTRTEARTSRAPAPVIERIDSVLAAVAVSSTRVQAQRAATLVLQDRVAQEVARCEGMLGRIATVRQSATGRLLDRDSVPLWHAEQRTRALTELPDRVRSAVTAHVTQLRQFAEDQRRRIVLQVALFAGLVLLMRAARRRAHGGASHSETTAERIRVFDRPVSAALVLAVLASPWIYSPGPPRAAVGLGQLLALVPALRVMRLLVDPPLVPRLYLLGAFFLADLVRRSASVVPLLEQQIFVLEMLAGVAVLASRLVASRLRPAPEAVTERERAARIGAGVLLLAFAVAVVAGAAGYMNLALFLGSGLLGAGYVALVLYAGVRVGDGLVAFALRARPLRFLAIVQHRRPLLERRVHRLLRWLAVGAWVILVLGYSGLLGGATEMMQAVLGAEVRRGSLRLSLGDVLVFALTVWAAFLLSALLRFLTEEEVYPRLNMARGLPSALSSLLHYAVLLVGFLLALGVLGVDLTKLTILAGAFGVGIGFGLQNVVNNFVSGLLVLFERRIDVGDAVEIAGVSGRMQQMGMRACTVRTWEGAEVIVPNAILISDKVTNWTLSDRRRRIDVAVGVAYGTLPEKVLDLLLAVARAHPQILSEPAPVALFLGFGESALRFEMRVWTDRFDLWVQTQSELAVAVYAGLREAGIEIPVPQRELRFRPG